MIKKFIVFLILCAFVFVHYSAYAQQPVQQTFPIQISVNADPGKTSVPLTSTMKIVILITILSLAPSILTMMTAFTRIIIILSFMKKAISTGSQPSNQIMVSMALFLTIYIMAPVWTEINTKAVQPLMRQEITEQEAFKEAIEPIRSFMIKYTRKKDLALFVQLSKQEKPATINDVPTTTLVPAFIISELKTAFQMGFVLFIPFLIIDMVTASVLLAMGMIVLPPMVISLPFKILMFVMVDGWYLIVRSITLGFE
ncbi:MAG: flagellar biosynthetic protein FliP [Candidatus Auribacter fodinae]|uniref:Flagellar biosynthetic protein FliP n=1 Tax=Candidatus Auribacter fodinae TaxID=2093366 RepID=A0A3A4R0N8_9BACT|nr:MAG: flagellar biosynthetic protein FliP [Candidatus Auribacter fodinae]